MAESDVAAISFGVAGSLLLALTGLLIGAWLAQFFPPPSPSVFLVPLVMNVSLGYALIRSRARVKTGQIILYGGTLASLLLPFVLL
ncbi:MAG: hypothetical protein LYZ66_04765 [Nitrososphaerales archaeon]|nr:hypothetical protein [Nitrososphaerales archaeon]